MLEKTLTMSSVANSWRNFSASPAQKFGRWGKKSLFKTLWGHLVTRTKKISLDKSVKDFVI